MNPALEIKTILNSNVDNNNNKVIVKKELAYITNNSDPVEITTNEVSRGGLLNKERMFSQNKTNNTKTTTLSPLFLSPFVNNPSNKDESSANIRNSHLRTDLENEQDSIDRRKCISVKSLTKNSLKENIQRSRQVFNPSHTKMLSKSYVWSDDKDSDEDQLQLNHGKISNVTTLEESLPYSYNKQFTSQLDIMSSKSTEEDDYQLKLDNDVEHLHVLSNISPDVSPSTPKTVARKAQEKLDYITNNKGCNNIKCTIIKRLSQNQNNINTNNANTNYKVPPISNSSINTIAPRSLRSKKQNWI